MIFSTFDNNGILYGIDVFKCFFPHQCQNKTKKTLILPKNIKTLKKNRHENCALQVLSENTLHHQHIGCVVVSETLPNKHNLSVFSQTVLISPADKSTNPLLPAFLLLKLFCLPAGRDYMLSQVQPILHKPQYNLSTKW